MFYFDCFFSILSLNCSFKRLSYYNELLFFDFSLSCLDQSFNLILNINFKVQIFMLSVFMISSRQMVIKKKLKRKCILTNRHELASTPLVKWKGMAKECSFSFVVGKVFLCFTTLLPIFFIIYYSCVLFTPIRPIFLFLK